MTVDATLSETALLEEVLDAVSRRSGLAKQADVMGVHPRQIARVHRVRFEDEARGAGGMLTVQKHHCHISL